jgi:bromodomain-containing factor 1
MHLNNHNDSMDFREPVDWRGKDLLIIALGLDDYPDVVKHPMDLSTINTKIKDKRYKTVESVLNDIQLIWDNCKLYNKRGSVN